MSHGSGGNAERLGWIASELAAAGMIVVAPNHPGTTSNDSDPFQTVKTWERPADLSAALDYILTSPPLGITPDQGRVGVLGYSLGGYSALGLAGVRLSKAAFITYCTQHPEELDCGWMLKAGVDFSAIDPALYEGSNRDPRVSVTVAVDPALPAAMQPDSLAALATKTLIINLGSPDTLPQGLKSDQIAAQIPGAHYHAVPGAHHFSFLPECSGLGFVIIGIAGDDNICSDFGFADRAAVHAEVLGQVLPFLTSAFGLPD
jgi:predicted dienelactone hydrolase